MSRVKNFFIIMITCAGLSTSCSKPNVLTQLSTTNSDDALLVDAQKEVDASSWDNAINIIENQMSAGGRTRRDVIDLWASAYAGKCGVNFLNLINGLKNSTSSASQIFPYFLSVFSGVTVTPGSCESAIGLLQSIGAASVRTDDENLFLAILGIARIATNMSVEIDTDKNGVIDSSTNVCHEWSNGSPLHPWLASDPAYALYPPPASQAAHFMTDSEIKRLAAGVGLIVENITVLGNMIGSSNAVVGALTSVTTACTSLGVTCNVTDPNSVSNAMIYAFRGLLNSSSMGFGTCVPGSVTAGQICCPTVKPPPASGVWP